MKVLFTDAAQLVGGWLAGVVDEQANLLESRAFPGLTTNLAEMEGVALAIGYMDTERGVVLTDSLDAVRFLGGNSNKHPYTVMLDYHLALRERVRAAWPDGWVLGWIPDRLNVAHAPLLSEVRKTPAATQATVPSNSLSVSTLSRPISEQNKRLYAAAIRRALKRFEASVCGSSSQAKRDVRPRPKKEE